MTIKNSSISLTLHWDMPARHGQIDYAAQKGFGLEVVGISYPPLHNDDDMFSKWIFEYKNELKGFPNMLSFHGPIADVIPHSEDDAVRMIAHQRVKKTIETAMLFGSDRIVFHSGINTVITDPNYTNRVVDVQAEFWKNILDEFPDITVCLENMWERNPGLFYRIKNKCGNDRLKFCFDTGHFNVYSEAGLREWFSVLGHEICHYHLSDNPGGWDSHLIPGLGTFNWEYFFEMIAVQKYSPQFVIELISLKDQKTCIEWLSNFLLIAKYA